ncbi:MADF domain, partial [Cinara cedri]
MCDWYNEFTLKFLEFCRNERVIWDPMHPYHRDRKIVKDAWVRLRGHLEYPVTELKEKKQSLMATFRGHLRKKKSLTGSGSGVNDIYKPTWFAYEYMESSLGPVYRCQKTIDTQVTSFASDEQSQSEEISSLYIEENQSMVTENMEHTSTVVPEQPNTTPRPTPTFRRSSNPPELQEAGNQTKEAFGMVKNVITKRTVDEEDDEYDLFAKSIMKNIRKLPERERKEFIKEIDSFSSNLNNVHVHSKVKTEVLNTKMRVTYKASLHVYCVHSHYLTTSLSLNMYCRHK